MAGDTKIFQVIDFCLNCMMSVYVEIKHSCNFVTATCTSKKIVWSPLAPGMEMYHFSSQQPFNPSLLLEDSNRK
ncbi:hypothetical protein GDO86_000562 [Hymenochirus boettgeri]|uniref:Uncharacterized protein n=1 Tax=Hymenochirus boettgeri TaxID=247094 RepID=A0A8T2KC78_9PIPI|nr:hypothetical protein GDO86_000562 [Hymenochirus boettgeri]